MLQIGVDCHLHSLFSGHAYCTIRDNVVEARDRGLQGIGIADHFGANFLGLNQDVYADPAKLFNAIGHFLNNDSLPRMWHGVRLFRSVEADITDIDGRLFGSDVALPTGGTLEDAVLSKADYAIASVHFLENFGTVTPKEGTRLYRGALQNPKVMILGHIGRAGIPFEVDEVLRAAREAGKIIEINEHSFHFSQDIRDRCRKIAIRCGELGVWIAVNSDAHCSAMVGCFPAVSAMLEEIRFPQELIANESLERFSEIIGVD